MLSCSPGGADGAFEVSYIGDVGERPQELAALVDEFCVSAKEAARILAERHVLREHIGALTSYEHTVVDTKPNPEAFSPEERLVYDDLASVLEMWPYCTMAYAAGADGGFAQAPAEERLSAGYNPVVRDWYRETVMRAAPTLEFWRSSNGEPACSAAAPIFEAGKVIGVAGLDLELTALLEAVRVKMAIADKEAVVLLDGEETVAFAFGRGTKLWLGRQAGELPNELRVALAEQSGRVRFGSDGADFAFQRVRTKEGMDLIYFWQSSTFLDKVESTLPPHLRRYAPAAIVTAALGFLAALLIFIPLPRKRE